MVGVDADGSDIHILVGHGVLSEILLVGQLAQLSELGTGANGGGLGGLSTGVGVHLRVKDHDVDVLLRGQHVVKTTEANVVGPAVTTDDPVAVAAEDVALVEQALELGVLRGLLLEDGDDLLAKLVVEGLALGQEHVALVLMAHDGKLIKELAKLVADGNLLVGEGIVNQDHKLFTPLLEGAAHTKAKLCVILEKRVGPGRTFATSVLGVGERGVRGTPDGRAASGVGDHEAIAEKLGQQLDIGSLAAAFAGAAELEVGELELRALDGGLVDLLAVVGESRGIVPVLRLESDGLVNGGQLECIGRADTNTQLATGAVQRGNLDAEVVVVKSTTAERLPGTLAEPFGGGLKILGSGQEWPDSCMGADKRAVVALSALVHVHTGNLQSDATLLVLGGTGGNATARLEEADGQRVALESVDGVGNALYEVINRILERLSGRSARQRSGSISRAGSRECTASGHGAEGTNTGGIFLGDARNNREGSVGDFLPGSGNGNLDQALNGLVDTGDVHLHNVVTLGSIHLDNVLLQQLDSLLVRHHLAQLEEHSLHNHVDPLAKTGLHANSRSIDKVELGVLGSQLVLDTLGQHLLHLVSTKLAVDHQGAVLLKVLGDVDTVDVGLLVDSNVIGILHQVRSVDGAGAKAKMGHSETTGLLGVVLEIALSIAGGVGSDHLDGSLVGANSTVRPKTKEQALNSPLGEHIDLFLDLEGEIGHVVGDTHREVTLGLLGQEVLVHGNSLAWSEVLATEAIATADDRNLAQAAKVQRSANVGEQGLANTGGVLDTVKNCDLLHRGREGGKEALLDPRAEETDLEDTDLLALAVEVMDNLGQRDGSGTHGNHDVLSIRVAIVGKGSIAAASDLRDLVGPLVQVGGDLGDVLVGSLSTLEENVRSLVGTLDVGIQRGQGSVVVRLHGIPRDELLDGVVVDHLDLVDLVRRTEAIEEMEDGDTHVHGGQVRNERLVHNHLGRLGAQHDPASGAARHDVTLVTIDVQGVGAKSTGRNVENAGKHLSGDFVHVGDHQEQSLGSSVGRSQSSSLQSTVKGTGSTALTLHFCDVDNLIEAVLEALRRPLVDQLTHS
mmetsp:Transcript_16002/g.43308  ORF Transcript_16002/g.43308 Transcript_16002/m.43308 type:complete len:1074 (+) Transcript_16002:1190-4411(+)